LQERDVQTIELKLPLVEAASEVLESMCFLSVLGEISAPEIADERWIGSHVEFTGEQGSGVFGICVTPGTGAMIAGNFLGHASDETSAAQVEEVLCELSNMICGSFLSRFRGDSIFDLASPACGTAVIARNPRDGAAQTLELDEGWLHLWVEFTP
jgi:CheY-specific phosphatase CheX